MTELNITASVASTLNSQEVNATRAQAVVLGAAAQASVLTNKFVFFAAFDGTNNNMLDVTLSGAPLRTNVAELYLQVDSQRAANQNLKTGYYAGVGTGDIGGGFYQGHRVKSPILQNRSPCNRLAPWSDPCALNTLVRCTTSRPEVIGASRLPRRY